MCRCKWQSLILGRDAVQIAGTAWMESISAATSILNDILVPTTRVSLLTRVVGTMFGASRSAERARVGSRRLSSYLITRSDLCD